MGEIAENMKTATLNCAFCCNEAFNSRESLRTHILDVLNELKCPICEKNSSTFENFRQHLKDCEPGKNTSKIDDKEKLENETENCILIEDLPTSEENQATTEYYCEICDVYFSEMKKHLQENHMGQQVVIESQDLDLGEILEEADKNDEPKNDTAPKKTATGTEHIFLEQEILDKDGKFYTKKVTKINIIPESEQNPPLVEEVTYKEISKGGVMTDKRMIVYRCRNCDIRFSQMSNYKKHDCNSKSGEVCNICLMHCHTKSELLKHRENYHNDKPKKQPATCDICQIEFRSVKSMMLHKRIHAPVANNKLIDPPVTYNINGTIVSEETIETFTCEICGKEYNKKYEEVHMKSHNEQSLNCSICNRKFLNKDDLSLHFQAHGNEVEKEVSCRFCKKTFSSKKSLGDHIQNQCEERKYCCSFCGKRFSKPHEKVKHERIHTGLKPFICQICGKTFRVSYCLTLHMRTHSGIRPYQCQVCNKRFKSHGAYKHHIQIHSDVRSYQCPFCPKAFKTAVQLAGHKNTHTKPFSCNTCRRPFSSLYAVRLHMKSHEGLTEFNHQCHICGAEYVKQTAYRDHLRTHSKLEEEELNELVKKAMKKNKKGKDERETRPLNSSTEEL